jgi:hypothetical protein
MVKQVAEFKISQTQIKTLADACVTGKRCDHSAELAQDVG